MDWVFCAERFLEACMEVSKKDISKHNKLIVYMINSEAKKTETIGKIIENFVVLQKTISSSLRDCPKPARPPSSKLVNRVPAHLDRQPRGKQPGAIDRKRKPEVLKRQNRNLVVDRLSYPFRGLSVDEKESNSTFYDDEENEEMKVR